MQAREDVTTGTNQQEDTRAGILCAGQKQRYVDEIEKLKLSVESYIQNNRPTAINTNSNLKKIFLCEISCNKRLTIVDYINNFLSNLNKLDIENDLNENEAKDVFDLCLHVSDSLKIAPPSGRGLSSNADQVTGTLIPDSTDLNTLVNRLSKRTDLNKVLMGAALVIVGCALASLVLFLLGGSVIVGAVAAKQLATYTPLTAAALTGLGAGGVGLSLAAGIGLFNHTKPKLSDLAQSAKVCVENFSHEATNDRSPGA